MTWPDEYETPVELSAGEIHVLTCAMAGNFPKTLAEHRMPVLRKLAKASRAVVEFREAYESAGRAAGIAPKQRPPAALDDAEPTPPLGEKERP